MSITIAVKYTNTLALPGRGSGQYSVSLQTELSDLNQAEAEIGRLCGLLQYSVDRRLSSPSLPPGHATARRPRQSGPVSEPTSEELEAAFVEERRYRHVDDDPTR